MMKNNKKILSTILLMFVFTLFLLSNKSLAWNNGESDNIYNNVRFGSHDWIALKANSFLPLVNQTWLNTYIEAYLRGTSAPDNSSESYGTLTGYGDTTNHHIYYNSDGTASEDDAADRAKEEYNKALNAMQSGKYDEAAWYAGCMTHYLSDVAVWGHVMTNESVHSNFENSANTHMDDPSEAYFQVSFDGTYDTSTAYQACLDIGWETYRGDITWQYNCVWMDQHYHYFDGSHPDDDFELRAEYLIDLAINKITDLLYTLTLYYNTNTLSNNPPSIPGFEFLITGIPIVSLIMIFYAKKVKLSEN